MSKYVYLIDPGDVLVFRNAKDISQEFISQLNSFMASIGVTAIVFDGDVDIDMLTTEQIARLRKALDEIEARTARDGGKQP